MNVFVFILVIAAFIFSIRSKKKKAANKAAPKTTESVPQQIRFNPDDDDGFTAPEAKEHLHPAMAPRHVAEYVPESGSMAEEAAAQGVMEGCEDLRTIRPVMTEQPAAVRRPVLTRDDILKGVVMGEVLGHRGGRRAL